MKYRLLLAIITCFSGVHTNFADPLISFFFKPYLFDKGALNAYVVPPTLSLLQRQQFFARETTGIFASYGGFLTISDVHGEVSFPRLHEKPVVTILVTSRITPMVMGGLTIHHWEREEGTPTSFYSVTREKDEEKNTVAWVVKKEPLPESMIIRPETIIIFADPSSLVIPTGSFPTKDMANWLLPDIYVKAEMAISQRALYVMHIKHFFGPIYPLYRKQSTLYQKNLVV